MQRSLDPSRAFLAAAVLDKIESARLDRRDGSEKTVPGRNEDNRDTPNGNSGLLELKARI